MKLFECIVDESTEVFKTVIAAKNKKELLSVWGGNGSFVKITDVTNDYTIDENKIENNLRIDGYGEVEIKLLKALLSEHNKTLK